MNIVQPIRDLEKLEAIKLYLKSKNERDYIMFLIGINTGLRISDILKLKVKDFKGSYLIIKEQKTNKRKKIIIIPALKRAVQSYISNKPDHEYIVKSRNGENRPICRSTAYRILNEAASHVGLQEIGTHTLRKTFGYHFYKQSSHDIAMLQDLFNHSSPHITLRYIGVNQDAVDRAMRKFKI